MAESTIVKNMRDGTLTVINGANTYEVAYEEGTLNLNIPGPTVANYLDRGRFTSPPSLRLDQDQPMTGSFTARLRDMSDASYATLVEYGTKSGAVAGYTSTLGASAEVFTSTLRWDVDGTNHGDATDHRMDLPYTWFTVSLQEGSPDMVTVNFTSYANYPTVT